MNWMLIALLVSQAPDTVVVVADAPPAWGSNVRVVEELRIGALDGADEYLFGSIRGIAITPSGGVYIGDGQIPAIREYDAQGRWVRNVGREGQGPGEYQTIYGMKSRPDGSMEILDPRSGRVTRYRDAEYVTSFPSLSGLHAADVFAHDTLGNTYVKTMIFDASVQRVQAPNGSSILMSEPPQAWIKLSPDGDVVDTLPIPPDDAEGPSFVLAGYGGYYRAFTTMTLSTMSPHGYMVWGRNDDYALHRELPDGRILRIERPAERLAVTDRERTQWEAWIDYFEDRSREQGRPQSMGDVPREKPFMRSLFVDDDGRIWVAVYAEARHQPYTDEERAERGDRPSYEWKQSLVWDVFDPAGPYLGRVTVPDGTSISAVRGDTLWGTQAGDFNEVYAVKFRIAKSGS